MEKHSCKTYFAIWFEVDMKRNAELIKEGRDCLPEELGILNKEEAEKFIVQAFGITPEWNRHHFEVGRNEEYNVDVNQMLRVTLKGLLGKEEKIKALCNTFGVSATLVIVPQIVADSEEVTQILSLDADIIEFLYKSGTEMDLDYYVI